MDPFPEDSFKYKLSKLNETQISIETLSRWILSYRLHSQLCATIWFQEFCLVTKDRRISFLYLANHVIQESKKQGFQELIDHFGSPITKSLQILSSERDLNTTRKIQRLVSIWEERSIFDSSVSAKLRQIVGLPDLPLSMASLTSSASASASPLPKVVEYNPRLLKETRLVPLLLEVERLEAPLIAAESNLGKIPDGFFNPDTIADKLTSLEGIKEFCSDLQSAANQLEGYKQLLISDLQSRSAAVEVLRSVCDQIDSEVQTNAQKLQVCLQKVESINNVISVFDSILQGKRSAPPFSVEPIQNGWETRNSVQEAVRVKSEQQ